MAFEVGLAETAEEKESVYRFRYSVYVEEMGRYQGRADHEGKRLVEPEDEHGVVHTRYYAFSLATERGGSPRITASTYAEDTLVRHEDGWLVRYRHVTHDGTD